jgi:hypothetical protein
MSKPKPSTMKLKITLLAFFLYYNKHFFAQDKSFDILRENKNKILYIRVFGISNATQPKNQR